MPDITLEQVATVCGNYTRRNGNNYIFQCPICAEEGHDAHKDNLTYNSDLKIVKCFANSNHSLDILDRINKQCPKPREQQVYVKPEPKTPIWEVNQDKLIEYLILTQDILLNRNDLLEYLYKKRGWTKKTIDLCGIGFDDTENEFTIPIISLKYDCIVNFERRLYGNKKQVLRIKGYGGNTIAKIWGLNKSKTLYLVEGFPDGITLTQWLLDKGQKDFTIYSCSNGVSSLYKCLSEINFSNFDEIKLILDNDGPGDKETIEIIEKYPFIKDSRKFLKDSGLKDVNEFYIKKVKKDLY